MSKKEIGVYIHIPFCKQKCFYCDFISFANCTDQIEKYIQTLKQEIQEAELNKYKIKTIYIGGGTPSFIDSSYIIELLEQINIKEAEEITIEVNPGTVTKQKLQDYFNAGINRLSIGLQSTRTELLKIIGRIHNYEDFLETYKLAREVGFKNINVDLIIGLPKQSVEDVESSLEKIIELNTEHISVYSLIVEENTKIEKMIEDREVTLPDDDTERKMYWFVKEKLEEAGYKHYEISNFSKHGKESKHNLDCWKQKEYMGFGLAAHSYMEKTRYSNTENLSWYIEEHKKHREIHEVQGDKDQQNEYMILGLRTIEGVNIQDFKTKFIDNPIYVYKDELNKLVNEKLIEIVGNYIRLTDKGIDLANIVWEEFC